MITYSCKEEHSQCVLLTWGKTHIQEDLWGASLTRGIPQKLLPRMHAIPCTLYLQYIANISGLKIDWQVFYARNQCKSEKLEKDFDPVAPNRAKVGIEPKSAPIEQTSIDRRSIDRRSTIFFVRNMKCKSICQNCHTVLKTYGNRSINFYFFH